MSQESEKSDKNQEPENKKPEEKDDASRTEETKIIPRESSGEKDPFKSFDKTENVEEAKRQARQAEEAKKNKNIQEGTKEEVTALFSPRLKDSKITQPSNNIPPTDLSSMPTKMVTEDTMRRKLEEEEQETVPAPRRLDTRTRIRKEMDKPKDKPIGNDDETVIREKEPKPIKLGKASEAVLKILEESEDSFAFITQSTMLKAGLKWVFQPMEVIDIISAKNNEKRWLNITNLETSIGVIQKKLNEQLKNPATAIKELYDFFTKSIQEARNDSCQITFLKEYQSEFGTNKIAFAEFLEIHIIPKLWALKNITENSARLFKQATKNIKEELEGEDGITNKNIKAILPTLIDTVATLERTNGIKRTNGIINLSKKEASAINYFFSKYCSEGETIDSALRRLSEERKLKPGTSKYIISKSDAIKNIIKAIDNNPQIYNEEVGEIEKIMKEVPPAIKTEGHYNSILDEVVDTEEFLLEIQKEIMSSFGILIQRLLAESLQSERRSLETQDKVESLREEAKLLKRKLDWEDIKTIYLYKFLGLTEKEVRHLRGKLTEENLGSELSRRSSLLKEMISSKENQKEFCRITKINKNVFKKQEIKDFIEYKPTTGVVTKIDIKRGGINKRLSSIKTDKPNPVFEEIKKIPLFEIPHFKAEFTVRTETWPLIENENGPDLYLRIWDSFEEALKITVEEAIEKLQGEEEIID